MQVATLVKINKYGIEPPAEMEANLFEEVEFTSEVNCKIIFQSGEILTLTDHSGAWIKFGEEGHHRFRIEYLPERNEPVGDITVPRH